MNCPYRDSSKLTAIAEKVSTNLKHRGQPPARRPCTASSHSFIHRRLRISSAPSYGQLAGAATQHEPGRIAPAKGVAVIEAALATMPLLPGVYRMLDAKGEALYVGKARSLKKRVAAYTQLGRLPERLRRMVTETVSMEVVTTHTEAEALLLEANLIKRLKPRFNIVLRDDKSYPWLMLTEDHPFPQIAKHRGAQRAQGQLLGPVRLGLGGQPDRDGDAAGVPAALLRRHGVRQPHPPLPAVPDPPLLGALRRDASARPTTPAWSAQAKAFLAGKRRHGAARAGGRDGAGRRRRWNSSARPPCATASGV